MQIRDWSLRDFNLASAIKSSQVEEKFYVLAESCKYLVSKKVAQILQRSFTKTPDLELGSALWRAGKGVGQESGFSL